MKDHLFGKARNVCRNTKCISLVMLSGGDLFFVFVIFVYRVENENEKNNANEKTSSQSRVCYFTARPGTYPLQSSISSRSPPSSPYHRRVHYSSLEMFATFGLFGADGGRLNTLSRTSSQNPFFSPSPLARKNTKKNIPKLRLFQNTKLHLYAMCEHERGP